MGQSSWAGERGDRKTLKSQDNCLTHSLKPLANDKRWLTEPKKSEKLKVALLLYQLPQSILLRVVMRG